MMLWFLRFLRLTTSPGGTDQEYIRTTGDAKLEKSRPGEAEPEESIGAGDVTAQPPVSICVAAMEKHFFPGGQGKAERVDRKKHPSY